MNFIVTLQGQGKMQAISKMSVSKPQNKILAIPLHYFCAILTVLFFFQHVF